VGEEIPILTPPSPTPPTGFARQRRENLALFTIKSLENIFCHFSVLKVWGFPQRVSISPHEKLLAHERKTLITEGGGDISGVIFFGRRGDNLPPPEHHIGFSARRRLKNISENLGIFTVFYLI
jgi:hypothetical protein